MVPDLNFVLPIALKALVVANRCPILTVRWNDVILLSSFYCHDFLYTLFDVVGFVILARLIVFMQFIVLIEHDFPVPAVVFDCSFSRKRFFGASAKRR